MPLMACHRVTCYGYSTSRPLFVNAAQKKLQKMFEGRLEELGINAR
jgi:hypothetical protein